MTAPERIFADLCRSPIEPGDALLSGTLRLEPSEIFATAPYILATPEALDNSPEVQALIAAAETRGWNAAIEASVALARPPQWERKGKPGLWRMRRAKIADDIRALYRKDQNV